MIWEQHPAKDRHEPEAFRVFFDEQLDSGGALIVLDAGADVAIGMSRFHGYGEARSEIEIGRTFLARAYWGGIYNRELKELMLDHALRFVDSVVFLVRPQHLRSRRAVEKIGTVPDGSKADAEGRPSIVYPIDAEPSPGRATRRPDRGGSNLLSAGAATGMTGAAQAELAVREVGEGGAWGKPAVPPTV